MYFVFLKLIYLSLDIPKVFIIPKIEIHPPDDDLESIDEDYEEMYTMDHIPPEKKELIIKVV